MKRKCVLVASLIMGLLVVGTWFCNTVMTNQSEVTEMKKTNKKYVGDENGYYETNKTFENDNEGVAPWGFIE